MCANSHSSYWSGVSFACGKAYSGSDHDFTVKPVLKGHPREGQKLAAYDR